MYLVNPELQTVNHTSLHSRVIQLLFFCSYSTPYLATDSNYTAKRWVANLGVHGF